VKVRNPAGRLAVAFVKTNTSVEIFGRGGILDGVSIRTAAVEFTPAWRRCFYAK
jgi:hypothetical protein